jgi:hypothetical protein
MNQVQQLDKMSADDRTNFVGNNIYGAIQNVYGPELAPKITGMLLDESAVNFKNLLTNSEYLSTKVVEAHQLLMSTV